MSKRLTLGILLFCLASAAYAANWPERPTVRAVRVATPPVLDGDLSDAAWQSAPEITDFTQRDPDDGKPATQPTSIRVVYDDKAIYFGMKMTDAQRPTALLGRRDSFLESDFLSINIDSQHDRLSGASFTVTPANVQMDAILFNDIAEDWSWDAVWESAAKVVADGWIAEVRIPFSQLRFPEKASHTWGLNFTRRTVRTNEWARLVNVPKGQTGFVSKFADVMGIEGIRRERPLEIVPYGVARSDVITRGDRLDPFLKRVKYRSDGGVDLKYGLTSTLTLTGTINPDFGQVEVDPAVVNLSAFETFFPEKRPFFTEGANIFRFGDSPARGRYNFIFPPSFFYSRRIGRSPQGGVDADYVAAPSETTILGAAKVTGKLGKGWTIGVLDALTDAERARFVAGSRSGRQQVEPMTNYFVVRSTKELGAKSRVGLMATAVNRRLTEELSYLRANAYAFGIDGYRFFRDRDWIFDWSTGGTHVSGSAQAIEIAQRSPARYYQRPDAGHIEFDPTRTSLSGWGGKAMVSKQTGLWRPNFQVQAYSPGFETNDVGFMLRTDAVSAQAVMQYVHEKPTKRLREHRFTFGTYRNTNFAGDAFDSGAFFAGNGQTQKYWRYFFDVFASPSAVDDRLTRGGPLARRPGGIFIGGGFESDERKRLSNSTHIGLERGRDGSYSRRIETEFEVRARQNLAFSISPSFRRGFEFAQYVTQESDPSAHATFGRRYVFAELDQRTFELGLRSDWTINSRLSFQLYLQPFIASGDYHDFKQLARPRDDEYVPIAPRASEPDFNFRSVRGSAVMRWEFRPGSALFVVWNENRSDAEGVGDFRLRRDIRALSSARSHDVVLVKVSYWLPL